MSKNINRQNFKELVKKLMLQELKSTTLEEGLGDDPNAAKTAQSDWTKNTSQDERDLARKLAVQFGLGTEPEIKSHEKKFGAGSINEDSDIYEKELANKMFADLSQEAYTPEKNTDDISMIAIQRMMKDGLLDYDTEGDHDENGHVIKGSIHDFYWLNVRGMEEIKSPQDIIDNYFYSSGPDTYGDAEKAYFRGSEGGGMDEVASKLERPLDAEGNPITIKARVEDLATRSAGRVIRFGVDESGKQTVHVEWIQKFGGQVPSTITYADKVVVKDNARNVKEGEIEESTIRSHANGRGQNIKPGNFPQSLKRVGLKENLDQSTSIDNDLFLVVDNAFNRAHYNDLIGQTFKDAPGYAQVKVVKPEEVEKEKSIKYDVDDSDVTQEDYDYAAAEREFQDKETHQSIENIAGKKIIIKNMNEITNLLFQNHKRIHSILEDVKSEIAAERVINNKIAATDNMDTVWIFEIDGVDDNTVTLEFIGTAK